MARKKDVKWRAWIVYYIGRALEIFGLMLVTWAMFMFFGSSQMRPMLAATGAGTFFFVIGWLLAKDDPEKKR